MPRCFGMSVRTPQYSQRGTSPQILEEQLSHTLNKCVNIILSWEKTETLSGKHLMFYVYLLPKQKYD